MSARARTFAPVIERSYHSDLNACTCAVKLLLQKPVSKEGRPTTSGPKDVERSPNAFDATSKYSS
jgi:hypothetical protein